MTINEIHRETLAVLRNFITTHGYAPSTDELRGLLGVSSLSTVHERLKVLEREGLIERKGPRAIKVTGP